MEQRTEEKTGKERGKENKWVRGKRMGRGVKKNNERQERKIKLRGNERKRKRKQKKKIMEMEKRRGMETEENRKR